MYINTHTDTLHVYLHIHHTHRDKDREVRERSRIMERTTECGLTSGQYLICVGWEVYAWMGKGPLCIGNRIGDDAL